MGHAGREGDPLRTTPLRTAAVLLGLAAVGCAGGRASSSSDVPAAPTIEEAWSSASTPAANLDSLAAWKSPSGAVWLIATAKETHELLVFDAATGATLRHVGSEGDGPGSFRRPNGIAVAGDLCLVVERDNRRVQVLTLPDLTPVTTFGESVLRLPYGISVVPSKAGGWEVYVSDAYETANGEVPPLPQLGERIKHFRVRGEGSALQAELVRSFGATSGTGALRVVESLLADPTSARLLVAEEDPADTFIKIYDLDGSFTGHTLGRGDFKHQVEGIALRSCDGDADGGWMVVSDQGPQRTEFHLIDRRTLEPRGVFIGGSTANTDGIAIFDQPFAGFPDGALFAVDDDASVNAFRWSDVSRVLGLGGCAG